MNARHDPGPDAVSPAPERQSAVNKRLTPKRRRPAVENHDYGSFARRVIRGYSRRVASGDIEAITGLIQLAADIDTAIQQAITGLRGIGYSWADIGLRLGITRQSAQQRWGTRETAERTYYGPDPDGHDRPVCHCPYCDIPDDEPERGDQQ